MSDSAAEPYDIQALVAGFGHRWPWAAFVYGTFVDDAAANRAFLTALPGALGLAGPTSVTDRHQGKHDPAFDGLCNVAFTFRGLARLAVAPDVLYSFPAAFVEGMSSRADILGDTGRSDPRYWEEHWSGGVDFWLGIYARSATARDARLDAVARQLSRHGLPEATFDLAHRFTAGDTPVWIDDPSRQPGRRAALEHFGFRDGISNPPVKGLAPTGPLADYGGGRIDGKGRWHPLAAGEILHGYIDEIGEMPVAPSPASIAANGTYLVLRKLSQDVDAFRSYLRSMAERHDVTADALAERLVGRQRSGTPLVGANPEAHLRDFVYADDPDGRACPLGSHVRRVNPRDTLGRPAVVAGRSPKPSSLLVDRHRLLRRGIPYGQLVPGDRRQQDVNPPVDVAGAGAPFPGQGLLFVALNVDIVRQFEFVQSQWVSFGNDLDQGASRDPIAGGGAPAGGSRIVLLSGSEPPVMVLPAIPPLVETRGGDYFFLPGLRALRAIIDGRYSAGG